MSGFNGSGTFQISGVGLPYASGNVISSSVGNQLNTDLATGLSTCILKDGTQSVIANIPWNNFNINSLSAIGVGTAIPSAMVHAYKSSAVDADIWVQNANTGSGSQASVYLDAGTISYEMYASVTNGFTVLQNYSSHPLVFGTNNTERGRFSAAGGFSVGTTADPGLGSVYATGNVTAYYSDDRLKVKQGNIQNALDKVLSLDGFHYEANETANDLGYVSKPEVGLSAQQVQAVLPEVVVPAPIGNGYLTIQYERVIPLLVEAIKQLNSKVVELQNKLGS